MLLLTGYAIWDAFFLFKNAFFELYLTVKAIKIFTALYFVVAYIKHVFSPLTLFLMVKQIFLNLTLYEFLLMPSCGLAKNWD